MLHNPNCGGHIFFKWNGFNFLSSVRFSFTRSYPCASTVNYPIPHEIITAECSKIQRNFPRSLSFVHAQSDFTFVYLSTGVKPIIRTLLPYQGPKRRLHNIPHVVITISFLLPSATSSYSAIIILLPHDNSWVSEKSLNFQPFIHKVYPSFTRCNKIAKPPVLTTCKREFSTWMGWSFHLLQSLPSHSSAAFHHSHCRYLTNLHPVIEEFSAETTAMGID